MDEPPKNMFAGMSTLRAQERARQPPSEKAKALQAYLKKYTDDPKGGEQTKKKRKKRPAEALTGVRMIDGDNTGLKAIPLASSGSHAEEEAPAEDEPVIANPGEAELYARLLQRERLEGAQQGWALADEDHVLNKSVQQAKRLRHDSPDASPPRRVRHDSPDASPPRRGWRDSPGGFSPRKRKHDSPDASPPRRTRHDNPDPSPPRRKGHGSPDVSPPRRGRQDSPDASPPRRGRHDRTGAPSSRIQGGAEKAKVVSGVHGKQEAADMSPPRRDNARTHPPAGIAAGIATKEELAEQLEKKRNDEKRRSAKLEAANNFKHAETIYRDKASGQRLTKEEYEANQRKEEKQKAKYETPQWGGGVKQMRDREEQAAAMSREASRQFARTRNDVDEELNLRDRSRFGDPMAHLVKKKASLPPPSAIPQHLAKQMKSGFIIPQEVPSHSWLKRGLGPPPNRYGIKPGRHWDGVDRSTGFERDMFKQQAARNALEQEARMWAQSDM